MIAETTFDTQPHSIEMEQQLLGALLVNNDLFHRIASITQADHFFEPVHGAIWRNVAGRIDKDHLASPVTVAADMAMHDGLKELGGAQYVARLAAAAIGSAGIEHYARDLEALWQRRMVLRALESARDAVLGENDPEVAKAGVEAVLMALPERDGHESSVSATKAMTETVLNINRAYTGEQVSVPVGIADLDKRIGGFWKQDLVIVAGRPSMGKAQPLHSRIKTPTGWVRMGEIQIGQKLASLDGEPSMVTGIFPQGKRDIYRITFNDGRSVECSGEHLWKIESSKFKGERVVETTEIKAMLERERYQGRVYIPRVSGDFGAGDVPIDPWFLGVLIGDGALTKGVVFSTPDAEILFRVQSIFGAENVVSRGAYDYAVTTPKGQANPTWCALKELNLAGKLSSERFIPTEYLLADRPTREELLRGLMDTDGWVEKTGSLCYATSSEQLAKDVQELVWSLGGVCSVSSHETTHLRSYRLYIRHDSAENLVTLQKKRNRVHRTKRVRMTIQSVEKIGHDDCCCISVSHPSHLYVTDNYVVTHNTALALEFAIQAADAGRFVGFVSLEMSNTQLMERVISAKTRIDYEKLRRGAIEESEMRKVVETAKEAQNMPLFIVPPHVRDIAAIHSALKQIKKRQGRLDLVVVDYLQLIRSKGNNANERVSEITQGLKALAKMLDAPVIALSQLSRAVEMRDNKRPVLSDLRDSGSIEQDADVVLFCYREEYYLSRETPPEKDGARADYEAALSASRNRMDIITAKQRMGSIGVDRVGCHMPTNRFWSLSDQGGFDV